MQDSFQNAAENFLELSSYQRLHILYKLLVKESRVTSMAKELDATTQEVHRNFMRLEDGGFITKSTNGGYNLTTFGRTMCSQVPSLVFLSQNQKYFEKHDFGGVPTKFILRVGQLASGENIKGITKVFELWKQIYKNANEYINKVSSEVPLDIVEPLVKKIRSGVHFMGVLSESAVVPKGRKVLLKKLGYDELIEKGDAERRMKKEVKTTVVLNEKEACVSFPSLNGETDMTQLFYSNDPMFQEWCLDYFRYCWYDSDIFQESKLKE